MKTFRFGLIAVTSAIMVVGCTNKQQQAATEQQNLPTQTTTKTVEKSIYGTYEGTLPAADCEGIKTTLTIREDSTYCLISEYLGSKADNPIETNGIYHILNKDLIELITPSSGTKTYYKILEDAVTLTDSTGIPNKGELADLYILKKK